MYIQENNSELFKFKERASLHTFIFFRLINVCIMFKYMYVYIHVCMYNIQYRLEAIALVRPD